MLPKWVLHWAELIVAFHLYFLEREFLIEWLADVVLLGTEGPKNQHAKVMGGMNPQGDSLGPAILIVTHKCLWGWPRSRVSPAPGPLKSEKEMEGGGTSQKQILVRGGVAIHTSHAKLPSFSPQWLWKWLRHMSPLAGILWILLPGGVLEAWGLSASSPKTSITDGRQWDPKVGS